MNRCKNDATSTGSCSGFAQNFQSMQSIAPCGPGGNGITTTKYPYGITPVKYFPSGSSSVGRSMWDGWRYGSNYIGPNEGKVYGEPDYKYYRHNYCGPCGCAPPGYMGDPNGKNDNIRYVQLDYKNLLGSGFAQQGLGQSQTSQMQMGQGPSLTSCGRNHCTQCSGVFKKKEQDVKFQVCLGDPSCPETMPPCPQQEVKVYVPNQMLPPSDDCGDGEDDKPQQYEITIPGYTDASQSSQNCGGGGEDGEVCEKVEPCGNCKACKLSPTISQKAAAFLVRSSQQCKKQGSAPPRECCCCDMGGQQMQRGQRCTKGPVLCNVRRPIHPSLHLRKPAC